MAQTGQNTKDGEKMLKSNVLPNHFLFGGTVPANNFLFDGTVQANIFFCQDSPGK